MRLRLFSTAIVSTLAMNAGVSASQNRLDHTTAPVAAPSSPRDGRHDFDFLHGTWRIHNRWRAPLSASSEWIEFEGRSVERALWNGQANLEEYDASRPSSTDERCCPVIELRQYELHPGKRETLIGLFEREFVEPQEAEGMTLVGQFRDLDRPNVFTWIRGFRDMESRPASLNAFYSGPVWKRYRDSANATMVSSDNVRLLHPAGHSHGLIVGARPAFPASGPAPGLVVATIYTLAPSTADSFVEFFERVMVPVLESHGATPIAVFETDQRPNNFPRLPVREGERAFVWFARFDGTRAHDRAVRALAADRQWTSAVLPELQRRFTAPAETLRLTPTARSRVIP